MSWHTHLKECFWTVVISVLIAEAAIGFCQGFVKGAAKAFRDGFIKGVIKSLKKRGYSIHKENS
jgi:hypothetical protein